MRKARRAWHNTFALVRRHAPHGVAEVTLAVGARLWPSLSVEFRDALLLAAIAAFVGSFVVTEVAYQTQRGARRIASAVVSSAARQLRTLTLSVSDAGGPLRVERRTVTLGDVGGGERVDLSGSSLRAEIARLGDRLDDGRGRFASTIGTQMPFLEADEQELAVRTLIELDRATVLAGGASHAAWRAEVLSSRGIRGDELVAFNRASGDPLVDELHRALAAGAAAIDILAGAEPLPMQQPVEVGAARHAARDVARLVIENAIRDGVSINWWEQSSMRGREEITMRTLADIDDLTFDGQGATHGWAALNEMLRQEARFARESISTIEQDLDDESLRHLLVTFADALDACSRAAYSVGEAGRDASDARVKGLPTDVTAAADAAVIGCRAAFIAAVREAVSASDRARAAL